MSGVYRPTLPNTVPQEARQAITRLQDFVDQLQAANDVLVAKIAAQPAPLTLQDIRAGLSAGGAAPLDLTGLTGTPSAP